GVPGPHSGQLLDILSPAWRERGTQERPAGVAIRPQCRNARGRLRDEWAAARDVWHASGLVAPALSRHSAGVFPAREHAVHGRLLAGGSLAGGSDTLLSDVVAWCARGNVSRPGIERPDRRAIVLAVRQPRTARRRGHAGGTEPPWRPLGCCQ